MPREAAILPGNVARNENIKKLQTRWACGKGGCATYCFIRGEEREHQPLSVEMLEVWASAMVSVLTSARYIILI